MCFLNPNLACQKSMYEHACSVAVNNKRVCNLIKVRLAYQHTVAQHWNHSVLHIWSTPFYLVESIRDFSWHCMLSLLSGSMVRIDTTLLGFDGGKWERGSRTYVFKAEGKYSISCVTADGSGISQSKALRWCLLLLFILFVSATWTCGVYFCVWLRNSYQSDDLSNQVLVQCVIYCIHLV